MRDISQFLTNHEIPDNRKPNLKSPGWAFSYLVLHLGLTSPRTCQPRKSGYPSMAVIGGRGSCDNGLMGLGNFEWRVFLKSRWRILEIISSQKINSRQIPGCVGGVARLFSEKCLNIQNEQGRGDVQRTGNIEKSF